MWVHPVTLTGRVVRLEPLTPAHAADLHRAADPDLFRTTPQGPAEWSEDGFRREIETTVARPNTVALAIVHLPTGAAIGRTTYMDIRPEHRALEIGRTWIGRAHHGTAVNPEAKLLMLAHAFEALGASRVQFTTALNNHHSQAAIAKLGAVREGVLRNHLILADGRRRDTVFYSILDSEWPAVKDRLLARLASV